VPNEKMGPFRYQAGQEMIGFFHNLTSLSGSWRFLRATKLDCAQGRGHQCGKFSTAIARRLEATPTE